MISQPFGTYGSEEHLTSAKASEPVFTLVFV